MKKINLSDVCVYRKESISVGSTNSETYISTECMLPGKRGVIEPSTIPRAGKVSRFYVGDILLSNIRPYFKKIWLADRDGGCSNDVLVIVPEKCDGEYLFSVLSNDDFFEYVSATSKGTKMPRGDKSAIMAYLIPDYDDKTQRRIASILRPVYRKIKLNDRTNDYLAGLQKAIYREFVAEKWRSSRIGTLSELLEVKYGKDHKKLDEGCVPVYGSGGLMRKVEPALYEGESVLIPRKGTLTNVMYVNEPFWTVDTMFYTIPKCKGAAKYAYEYLLTQDLTSMDSGSAVPSMTTAILNALQLPIPLEAELEQLDIKLEPLFALQKQNQKEVELLEDIRNTLLPKLMSGEIDISQIELCS